MANGNMIAEYVGFRGHAGDRLEAYLARPLGPGPHPCVVLIHHLPGWDEFCMESARKLAHHGFATIYPNLYSREGAGDRHCAGLDAVTRRVGDGLGRA